MTTYAKKRIVAEAEKCQLLCHRCHIDVTKRRRDEHWIMLFDFCAFGESCFEDLSKRFHLPIDEIEEIVEDRMYQREIRERFHGKDWINFVCWS